LAKLKWQHPNYRIINIYKRLTLKICDNSHHHIFINTYLRFRYRRK
jgi:hypothetical protein